MTAKTLIAAIAAAVTVAALTAFGSSPDTCWLSARMGLGAPDIASRAAVGAGTDHFENALTWPELRVIVRADRTRNPAYDLGCAGLCSQ
jgi:hypothetical protein